MHDKYQTFILWLNFTTEEAVEFIKIVASLKSNGPGSRNQFSEQLDILESDGLRVLLGKVPESWVTEERKRLFVALSNIVSKQCRQNFPGYWSDTEEGWRPKNNRAQQTFDLANAVPDFEFMDSFGLRKEVWEREILKADMNALKSKVSQGADMQNTNLRLYAALAMFGFDEPEQFFVKT